MMALVGGRHIAAAVGLVLLACEPRAFAQVQEPSPAPSPVPSPAPAVTPVPSKWSQDTAGAIITKPIGGNIRHDVRRTIAGNSLRAGVFGSYQIVSTEAGAMVSYVTDPAFLEFHVEGAVEPGFYIQLEPGEPGGDPDATRTFGWRYIARAQANTNLRVDRIWIYGRTTGYIKWRDFLEDDQFRGITIEDEYSIEQATAFIYRVNPVPVPGFWVYTEYTVGGVDRAGTIPHRISGGVITEAWLARGLSMNLDLFYSFDRKSGVGPGLIFAWWHHW